MKRIRPRPNRLRTCRGNGGVWAFGSLDERATSSGSSNAIAPNMDGKWASKRASCHHGGGGSSSKATARPFYYKFVEKKDGCSIEIPSDILSPVKEASREKDGHGRIEEGIEKNEKMEEDQVEKLEERGEGVERKEGQEKKQENKEEKPTFGSGGYKDAGISHPEWCPLGGSWSGYFENIPAQGRKLDKRLALIEETFVLFFNSNAPSDVRITFPSGAVGGEEEEERECLPENHIHVRGMGSNQFGTFEIVGSLNLSNRILHLQRMYIPVPTSGSSFSFRRAVSEKRKEEEGRKYFTRKKIMSWQRPQDDSDDDRPQLMRFTSLTKKRPRTNTQDNTDVAPSPLPPNAKSIPNSSNTTIPLSSPAASSLTQPITDVAAQPLALDPNATLQPTAIPPPISSSTPLSAMHAPQPSDPAITAAFKKKSKQQHQLQQNHRNIPLTHQPQTIHLPPAPDPLQARWRSAHYIFFQRNLTPPNNNTNDSSSPSNPNAIDPTPPSSTLQTNSPSPAPALSANTPSIPPLNNTTVCIYEGEFLHGYGMREGAGICLYPNGNIYEGTFRRNKESGRGALYSGDRKRLLYTGDWERGKMHGRGKYYYYADRIRPKDGGGAGMGVGAGGAGGGVAGAVQDDFVVPHSLFRYAKKKAIKDNAVSNNPPTLAQYIIGVYEGDFKENARHGFGTYILPDGSVYDGEWRENLQNGRGTFTWPDGSVYSGLWKDGKRHGQGMLKASDGFSYEGSWVNNAMEGRGICIYPNGQRYEGIFHLGKKEGRGTIRFTNGCVYEGRFKDDFMEGQGTMKMNCNVLIPANLNHHKTKKKMGAVLQSDTLDDENEEKMDWMIPIEFRSDMGHIHQRAGFDHVGS